MESVEHYLETKQRHRQADLRNADPVYCYFIGGKTGQIKIGATMNVKLRLRELQRSSPTELQLLAVALGGYERERAYHYEFGAHRLHGEWFARNHRMLKEIRRLGLVPPERPSYPKQPRDVYWRF